MRQGWKLGMAAAAGALLMAATLPAQAKEYLAFDAEIQFLASVDDFSTEELMAGQAASAPELRTESAA